MGILRDRLQAELADIDARILTEQTASNERLKALLAQRAALAASEKFLTDELEDAVMTLQKLGFLGKI